MNNEEVIKRSEEILKEIKKKKEKGYEIQAFIDIFTSVKSVNKETRRREVELKKELKKIFKKMKNDFMTDLRKLNRPSSNSLVIQSLLRNFRRYSEEFVKVIVDKVLDSTERGNRRTISNLQRQGVSIQFDKLDKDTIRRLRNLTFEASENTINRMIGDVEKVLIQGEERGLGIDEIAKLLEDKFERMEEYELERIARTEINSAQNYGSQAKMEKLGIDFEMWITAEDERVRDGKDGGADHVVMHGQITRRDDLFSNGLKHPGDKNGDISEWINCRCTVIPFIIPVGKRPPTGATFFYKWDLVDVS